MKVVFFNQINYKKPATHISFNAIELSEQEKNTSNFLLNKINGCSDKDFFVLNKKIYELYKNHLDKEVATKVQGYHLQEDFSQEIYLKFFEMIEEIRKDKTKINSFIDSLNKYNPSKTVLKSGVFEKSIDKKIGDSHLFIKDILVEENLPVYASAPSEEEKLIAQGFLKKVVDKTELSQLEEYIINKKSKGITLKEISKDLNKSYTRVQNKYTSGIAKIRENNNILSQEYDNFANELKTTFDLENDIEWIKTFLIKNPEFFKKNREVLYANIYKLADLFDVKPKQIVKASFGFNTLLSYKPETISENVSSCAELLGIQKEKYINVCLKYPMLFSKKSTDLKKNVEKSAKDFGITKTHFIKEALKFPALFYLSFDKGKTNIENIAKLLDISDDLLFDMAKNNPVLYFLSSNRIKKNVEMLSNLLNIDEEIIIKASKNSFAMLMSNPMTINKNIEECSEYLGVSKKDYTNKVMKKPRLISKKRDVIQKTVKDGAEILNIKENEYKKIVFKNPALFFKTKESLVESIKNLSTSLGLKKEEVLKMVSRQPNILCRNSENLKIKIEEIAKILGVEKSKVSVMALIQPQLYTVKADTVVDKVLLNQFYLKATGQDSDSVAYITYSNEYIYNKIIFNLIKKYYKEKGMKLKNLPEYVKKLDFDTPYNFSVPNSKFSKEFVEYAKGFFRKQIGNEKIQIEIV